MNKLLIISYDAVGDKVFSRLQTYPNFRRLAARSAVVHKVKSVFLSNTYPIHTSVVTGRLPCDHGLISNTDMAPVRNPKWWYESSRIKAPTLWDTAYENGLTTAAVLWPVTGKAKGIRWNVPESMAQPGESQILTNFKNGSRLLQMKLFSRHRHLIDGIKQPALDRFTTACMTDILREHKPDLGLVHLTAFDSLCHQHGVDSSKLDQALQAMDENLGAILDAAGDLYHVILFSDHAQLSAEKPIYPNELLDKKFGLLNLTEQGYEGNGYFECCGGSAFFHGKELPDETKDKIKKAISTMEGFNRYLTEEECKNSGRFDVAFGFCAKVGYGIHNVLSYEKGNHGYPLDYPDYEVFYMGCGSVFQDGVAIEGGSLLDIAPLACKVLGLTMEHLLPVREELLEKG